MSVLRLISLEAIDTIFKNSSHPLGASEKQLYINCLIHHFRGMPPTAESIAGFELKIEEIPNYDLFKNQFNNLQKAGLVDISIWSISFINHWGNYIDKNDLKKALPKYILGNTGFTNIEELKDHISSNTYLFELTAMLHKLCKDEYILLIDLFIREQMALGKEYISIGDCLRHFNFWIPANKLKIKKDKKPHRILGE